MDNIEEMTIKTKKKKKRTHIVIMFHIDEMKFLWCDATY